MASLLKWQCHTFDRFSLASLYQMLRLRDQVFVQEQQSIYGDLDNLDHAALHVCGYDAQQKLLAYARILAPGSKYPDMVAIGRVVIAPERRGHGIGRQLMQQVLQQCQQHFPGINQQLSAQLAIVNFYQSLGFNLVSAPCDDGGIAHVDMLRQTDTKH